MATQFVTFIDITGENASRAPLVKDGLRAYYATGTSGIEETAAQVLAAKDAGMGIALYDQTPSLSVFAAGWADIADIENYAGTIGSALAAVEKRQAQGWQSTLYISYDNLSALRNSVKDTTGVLYGIADYSWSIMEAQNGLDDNPDWAYVQYGDPESNPNTLVPGTDATLAECQGDINVARATWANQFLPKPPPDPHGPYRKLTTGDETAQEIADGRHETVEGLLKVSAAHYTNVDLATLASVKIPAGVVYYTVNP